MQLLLMALAFTFSADDDLVLPIIVFPMETVPVEPPPKPKVIETVNYDEAYVVQSSTPLIIRTFAENIVAIHETTGPKTVIAKFAGGKGKVETREFTASYLYFIAALNPGSVAVDFIPEGIRKSQESQIKRHILTVPGAPNPPPDPDPIDPEPEPTPPTPVTYEYVRLFIVEDSINRSPQTALTLNGLVTWAKFLDGGHEYRIYDKTTKESKGKKAINDIGSTALPAFVMYDRQTGSVISFGELPPTFPELKAVVNLQLTKPVAKYDALNDNLEKAVKSAARLQEVLQK